MQLNLSEIPTFIINCTVHRDRREHMAHLCQTLNLNFEIIDGIVCKPGYIGCMLSHLKVLSLTHPPFLILEDDCNITPYFRHEVECPDNTDLLYLGVSAWGICEQIYPKGLPFASYTRPYGKNTLRLENMLSTHAILYLNAAIVNQVKDALMNSAVAEIPCDIGMAKLQKQALVLTPQRPFFYQDQRMGGQERFTRMPIRTIPNNEELKISRQGNTISIAWHGNMTTQEVLQEGYIRYPWNPRLNERLPLIWLLIRQYSCIVGATLLYWIDSGHNGICLYEKHIEFVPREYRESAVAH